MDWMQLERSEKSAQYPGATTGKRRLVELHMKGSGLNDTGFGHNLQFVPYVP